MSESGKSSGKQPKDTTDNSHVQHVAATTPKCPPGNAPRRDWDGDKGCGASSASGDAEYFAQLANKANFEDAEKDEEKKLQQKISLKAKRREQNALVLQLDAMIPEEFCTTTVKNGAGARSLGTSGRSLIAVLTDTIECLKALRARHREAAAKRNVSRIPAWVPALLAIDDDTLREGMRSSHSLVLIELDMPGWIIENMNSGAEQLFGSPPWGDSRGQCFVNTVVHRDDLLPLHEMWYLHARISAKAHTHKTPWTSLPTFQTHNTSIYIKAINQTHMHAL